MAGQAAYGAARCGAVRCGQSSWGVAGMVGNGLVRRGGDRSCKARQGRRGIVRFGTFGKGLAGKVSFVWDGFGGAWSITAGAVSQGVVW